MLHEGLKYVSRETTGQKERFMHEDLLKRHLELVIEANKTTNITRISSWEDGMVLHVQDSLLGLDALNACPEGRYADIGTGAGYPGIPLAIETGRPTLLVDSVQKKVQILDGFIEELGLDNVSTYAGRIEDLGREQAGQFAAISARALSKLSVLLELSSPLLKMGAVSSASKPSLSKMSLITLASSASRLVWNWPTIRPTSLMITLVGFCAMRRLLSRS